MWDLFTEDQWNSILQNHKDESIASTISQLWRASY